MDGRTGRDSELVAQAREGDLQAFDRLVARHRARVFGIARQIVSDPDTAQDLAQEALLRAYRSLGSLRNGDRIGQWLNTTVRRLGQEWLRGGRRRPEPVDGAVLLGVPGGFWSAPSEPPAEVVARVHTALAALSQRERRVMILHYLEGRSCDEIAAQLGLHPGSVKRILHCSRRKARKECDAMAEEEKGRQGPRQLEVWYSGEVPQGRWDVFARTRHALVQTICLTTNKRAKTVPQIAEEVQAHATYVADAVRELADLEVLTSPRKGQYRLSFIAFEAADWRRVTTHVRQPAAEAAHRMVQAEGALRDAFAKTPLSKAGWTWQDVCWVIYCFCLATRGAARAAPAVPQTAPMRPGGVRYWLGGHEWTDDMSRLYTTSFCGGDMGGQGAGYFGTSAGHEGHLWLFEEPYRALNLLRALLDGPRGEDDLLAQIQDEPEQQRAALARLVEASLVEAAGGRLRVTMPVFGGADSDLLTPVLDGIAAPIMREVVMPTWADLDRMLDDMGYGHHRDQYRLWHRWLEAYVMGEALRFLGEQDVLPRITDDAPAKWVFVAWKGDLPLMSMQAEK